MFDREEDMMIAKGLLETCVFMYQSSETGLCPERWTYYDLETETFNGKTYNKSKPEIRRDRYLLFHPHATEEEIAANERKESEKDQIYAKPPPVGDLEGTLDNGMSTNKRPVLSKYGGRGGDLMYLLRPGKNHRHCINIRLSLSITKHLALAYHHRNRREFVCALPHYWRSKISRIRLGYLPGY